LPSAINVRVVSRCFALLGATALLFAGTSAPAQIPLTQLSTDTFTNSTSEHATEVEPASYAHGNTVVTTFQVGRFSDGGASDIGFSTSTNGGATWTEGYMPGITSIQGTGPYERATDTSVVYNNKYKLWLVGSLAVSSSGGVHGQAVLVSSSTNGITWNNPSIVSTVEAGGYYDKPWIGCDNTSTSPYYGNCYMEWDDYSLGDQITLSSSTDGGTTWSAKQQTGGKAYGTGGIPLVQPNGTVIVPIGNQYLSDVLAFTSTNGGSSWTAPITVTSISEHTVEGNMRALPLIAAQMDAAGTVYVVWADCRFRSGCSSNDLVMTTSTDGTTWSAVSRIPIDAVTSTFDHFTPGFAIEPGTSGSTAKLALTYNFFPNDKCTSACNLSVGYIASSNGGSTWGTARTLDKGMNPTWLPSTTQGYMAADYQTSVYVDGKVHGVFPVAKANAGTTYNQAMNTNTTGLAEAIEAAEKGPQFSSKNDKPVPGVRSQVHRTRPHRDDGDDE
jgi:hypothetical protein